jgi:hypothetical protein
MIVFCGGGAVRRGARPTLVLHIHIDSMLVRTKQVKSRLFFLVWWMVEEILVKTFLNLVFFPFFYCRYYFSILFLAFSL